MSDYFFYDLNKKMADLANKQQLTENAAAAPAPKSKLTEAAADYSAKKAAAGKDIGKPGKNFSKIAAGAAKRYGSAEAGKRVAGAVLNKLRHPSESIADEGNAFSGAVAKAKSNGIQPGEKIRVGGKQYPVKEQGVMDVVKKVGNVAGAVGGAGGRQRLFPPAVHPRRGVCR